jgi:hypothetical protein
MTRVLQEIQEGPLLVVALLTFLVIMEAAYRLGRRHESRSDDVIRTHVTALQSAVLGLLSLLLGFNFVMAVARFDARRTLIQEEVSAINTAHLRAQLLAPGERREATSLLRAYVATRVELTRAVDDSARIEAAIAAAAQIQRQLWAVVEGAVAQGSSAIAIAQFIQSANEVITVNDKRRAALDNHVPETVLDLLVGVAGVALGFIAYGYGLTGRRRHGAAVIYATLIAVVLTVIVDLDRPRSGFIRVSDDAMIRMQETLGRETPSAGPSAAPPPGSPSR